MGDRLRILLLADTHLGFDLPRRPRTSRRLRGPDFFANYERALAPARRGEVDLVVHGGDLLFRSRVRQELVERALEPLIALGRRGLPTVLVPGNHERSALPFPLLAAHRGLHLLDRPRTVELRAAGLRVAVAGFPCERDRIRDRFSELLGQTGWEHSGAQVRLLCLHQTVEGARVGPSGYTFRSGAAVLPGRCLPQGFAAVLAGHIHRRQRLTHDLEGRPLAAPVLYPGSIERTSFAERNEPKGFVTLEVEPGPSGGRMTAARFHPLPARPMVDLRLPVAGLTPPRLLDLLDRRLGELDPDSVVRLTLLGEPQPEAHDLLTAPALRALAPETMSLTVRPR